MRITFTGDILCYQSQDKHCKKADGSYDYTPVFEQVKPLFAKSDYVVGSFETTCSGKEAGYTHADTSFNTPDELLSALKDAGFDLLTTANNHCLDRGEAGLLRTIQKIKENGLEFTGTRSQPTDPQYLIKDFGGTKVAFLAYSYGTNSVSNGNIIPKGKEYLVNLTRAQDAPIKRSLWKKAVLAVIPKSLLPNKNRGPVSDCVSEREVISGRNGEYENAMAQVVKQAKLDADIVVFCLHSGGQFNSQVGAYTQHLINLIADSGADAIVTNHAHTVLPLYMKGDCLVASALGNFSFAPGEGYYVDGVYADYSVLLHLDVDKKQKKIVGYDYDICKSVKNEEGLAIVKSCDKDGKEEGVKSANYRLTGSYSHKITPPHAVI